MLKERLAKLLTVKSLVTIILTILFAVLAIKGGIGASQVVTIYTIVIGFYFGTQTEKLKSTGESNATDNTDTAN